MAALLLAGCGSAPPVVPGPLYVPPAPPPLYVERPVNGAIFQPHMTQSTLFSSDRRPQAIGDTLKVDIAESLQASQKSSTDTGRDNKVSVKGPGKSEKSGGLFESLMNANASASSNDSFKGSGTTEASSGFNAHLAVTVINVLPNGHLLVAGERKMGLNGGVSVLRFSGVVDPHDIRPGNIVNSRDVANASLESGGSGDVSDAASRSWLQRVLSRSMAIW
jgi:flagellar L-ring protein precursor FlgH